jgi:hypothetical protein
MTNRERRDFEIMSEMYRRAYAASTPIGDFDAMVQNAPRNEFGQKVIPYLKYECEQEVMEQIIIDVLKEYKVPKRRHELFRNSFMLGCSPKTKQKVANE